MCSLFASQIVCHVPATLGADTPLLDHEIVLNFGGPGSDGANSIVPMSDGGYVLGGWTSLPGAPENTQSWVIRVDARGRALWDLPLPAAPYGVSALAPALDGGVFIIDSDPEAGTGRTRVSKISFEGVVEDQKNVGSSREDNLHAVQPTFDGGLILAGQTGHLTRGGLDAWIMKLDSTLAVEWFRTLGAEFDDGFEDVALASGGGYVAAGWTTGADDSVAGWTIRFDSLGSVLDERLHEFGPMTEIHAISPLPESALVFAATSESEGSPARSLVIGGIDSEGAVSWQQRINSEGSALATDLSYADDGSFLVSARLSDGNLTTGLVVNFTDSGDIRAANRHEGPTNRFALAVAPRPGGGYALAGSSERMATLDQDVWLVIRGSLSP